MKLKDKTAIITGASRGIGFAVAESFVREGAKVAVCGSRLSSAQKAVDKLKESYPEAELIPIGVDISSSDSIAEMVKTVLAQWDKIDILVNNAGVTSAQHIFLSLIHI